MDRGLGRFPVSIGLIGMRDLRDHLTRSKDGGTPDAVERAFYWTRGQPFLVNALARICVMELVTDRALPVTAAHVDAAKEALILSRTTHLDALGQRLKKSRVARVVQAVLLGDMTVPYETHDYAYVVDLGLVADDRNGATIANPRYREVLARELSYTEV